MSNIVDRVNKRFSKGIRIVLNILGFVLLALVLFLLYKLAKSELVYFLGKNFWLYYVICILLVGFIILKMLMFFDKKIDEKIGCFLCILVFNALLLGSVFLGIAIHSEFEKIDHEKNPVSIERVVSELTEKYESDGGQVNFSPELKRFVVTIDYNPDEMDFGSNSMDSFIEDQLIYCERESGLGREKFLDYGYDIDVYCVVFYDSGEVHSIGKNGDGESSFFVNRPYLSELSDILN